MRRLCICFDATRFQLAGALTLLAALFFVIPRSQPQPPAAVALTGDVQGTHDPSMIHAGDTWYVFSTGRAPDGGQLPIRCSQNLKAWQSCGHVFDSLPQWIQQRSPKTRDLWAPDVSYEHGEYRLYYTYSVFGKNTSGIALATNKTLDRTSTDYRWEDKGLIVESTATDNFNAIDANYFEGKDHRAWLCFGSFWSGIKMRALDPMTGKLSTQDTLVYALAQRGQISALDAKIPNLPSSSQAVEAPFLVEHGGYFYLFTSWDMCCRGVKSTYRTMVGRSKQVTGPYVDRAGVPLLDGGGTQALSANQRWLGPGGASITRGTGKTQQLLVYHAYDHVTGKPSLQLSALTWHDGWPQAAMAP